MVKHGHLFWNCLFEFTLLNITVMYVMIQKLYSGFVQHVSNTGHVSHAGNVVYVQDILAKQNIQVII